MQSKDTQNENEVIHLFFASFIFNIFITFYSIYSFFEMSIFHKLQGSKLKFKKIF